MGDIFKTEPSSLAKVERGLKRLENEVYQEATEVLYTAVTHAFDLELTEDGAELPAAWLEEVELARNEAEAEKIRQNLAKRKRIALSALQSPKNAPVAFMLAKSVF